MISVVYIYRPVCDMSNEYLVLEVWYVNIVYFFWTQLTLLDKINIRDRDQKENDASNKGVKGLLTLVRQ